MKVSIWFVVACILCVLMRAFDLTLYYRIAYLMSPYILYFSSICYPVVYLVAITPVVLVQYIRGKLKDSTSYPLKRIFIMSILDQLANVLSSWPIPVLGGGTSIILMQLVIPFQILAGSIFLRTTYRWSHYAASLLAMTASVIEIYPQLTFGSQVDLTYFFWVGVMILSVIPTCGSFLYKEIQLKSYPSLDTWYINFIESIFQGLLGIPIVCSMLIPFIPGSISASQFFPYLRNANACFIGINSNATSISDIIISSSTCTSDSFPAIGFSFIYIFFNILFSVLMLVIFRFGSAVFFNVLNSSRIPIVHLLLLSTFIAGQAAEPFEWYEIIASALSVAGVVLYSLYDPLEASEKLEKREEETNLLETAEEDPISLE
jgi:CRT-like, chloroquine-resistance transporter-like